MKIVVASLSCCNPAARPHDQRLVERIKEALGKTGIEARVELLMAAEVASGLKESQVKELAPLLQKYGTAIAPMMFIDDELVLYGGVPPVEKLVEVIQKKAAGKPSGK